MEVHSTTGRRIKILRDHYRLNVKNFAFGCRVSDVTIFKIEKGSGISEKTLSKIIFTYGTTKEWLTEGKGEMLPEGTKELPFDEIEKRYTENICEQLISKNERIEKELEKIWRVLNSLKETNPG